MGGKDIKRKMEAIELAQRRVFSDIEDCVAELSNTRKYINVYEFAYSDKLVATNTSLHSFLKNYMHIFCMYVEDTYKQLGLYLYFSQTATVKDTYYKLVLSNDKYACVYHPDQIEIVLEFKTQDKLKEERRSKLVAWNTKHYSYRHIAGLYNQNHKVIPHKIDSGKLKYKVVIVSHHGGDYYTVHVNDQEKINSRNECDVSNESIFNVLEDTSFNAMYHDCWMGNLNDTYIIYRTYEGSNKHIILNADRVIMVSNFYWECNSDNTQSHYYELSFY